ncbi:phosphate transporter (Pho88) [Friedmanniomyces endolithicus]|nr:phosphate transporter (Pho88) [Friedmanniomyces endolithicus]
MVNPQITNLVIILGMMQVSKKIPFDDPNVLNGVRALYVVSNLVIVAIYLYTKMQIDKKRDMHLYFKYTNPLLIQSIIPTKGAFEGNLVKVHVLGYPASGDLKRPWKAAAGMMGMMGGQGGNEIKTDKKSIEAAEKAGRGGSKEE